MPKYLVVTPFLDECGNVYLPGLGEGGSAARLNDKASSLWRSIANTGELDAEAGADDLDFIHWLVANRAINQV